MITFFSLKIKQNWHPSYNQNLILQKMMQTKKKKKDISTSVQKSTKSCIIVVLSFHKQHSSSQSSPPFSKHSSIQFSSLSPYPQGSLETSSKDGLSMFSTRQKQIVLMRFLDIFGHFPPRCDSTMWGYIQLTIKISNAVSIPICDDEAADSSF